jgi:hypothetical protein
MPSFSWTSVFTNQTLTRSNFITNLRSRIDEDEADNISDNQIIELIRQGNYDICFRTGLLPEYATVSLDGSASYTLPTDMGQLENVFYVSADSTPVYRVLKPYNLDQIYNDTYSSDTVEFYVRNGQDIQIFGSGATTGTLRAYGTRIPTFPSSDSAYIDLPNQYLELMYMWCEWKFWVRRREPDEAVIARDLYFNLIKEVKDQVQQQYSYGVTAYG